MSAWVSVLVELKKKKRWRSFCRDGGYFLRKTSLMDQCLAVWSEQREGDSRNGAKSGKVRVGMKKSYCEEGLKVKTRSKLMEVPWKVGQSSDASYFSAQLRCLQALQLSLSLKETAHLHSRLEGEHFHLLSWMEGFKQAHQLELEDNLAVMLTLEWENGSSLRCSLGSVSRLDSSDLKIAVPLDPSVDVVAGICGRSNEAPHLSEPTQFQSPRPGEATRVLETGNALPSLPRTGALCSE